MRVWLAVIAGAAACGASSDDAGHPPYDIEARVGDHPAPGLTVVLHGADGTVIERSTTDAEGRARLTQEGPLVTLAFEEHVITTSAADLVIVRPPRTALGERLGSVTVVIPSLETMGPALDGVVHLACNGGTVPEGERAVTLDVYESCVDADGMLPIHAYSVLHDPQWHGARSDDGLARVPWVPDGTVEIGWGRTTQVLAEVTGTIAGVDLQLAAPMGAVIPTYAFFDRMFATRVVAGGRVVHAFMDSAISLDVPTSLEVNASPVQFDGGELRIVWRLDAGFDAVRATASAPPFTWDVMVDPDLESVTFPQDDELRARLGSVPVRFDAWALSSVQHRGIASLLEEPVDLRPAVGDSWYLHELPRQDQ